MGVNRRMGERCGGVGRKCDEELRVLRTGSKGFRELDHVRHVGLVFGSLTTSPG